MLKANTGNTDTVYTDDTLSAEMTRHYRVYAINSVGTSPGFTGYDDGIDLTNDNDAMAMTGGTAVPMLTAPESPIATAGSAAGTVDLNWMAGANATQHWILAIRADGALTGYTWVQASGHSSHTLTELDSGVAYIFGVNAGNDAEEWAGWVFTTGIPK